VYHELEARIREQLAAFISRRYGIEALVSVERPPRLQMGEMASPISFELAKRLKRAPRQIAQEIATELGAIPGVARMEVAGAGYLNIFFDRAAFFQGMYGAFLESGGSAQLVAKSSAAPKTIVEHTNINPNKAAHIGHLRNAILGDTFVRLLRFSGDRVEVQNFIDNTGVQVADVVLGFMHMEKKSLAEVKALAAAPKFDYYCWDLYARVTQYLEEDKSRMVLRGETMKGIEKGHGAEAEMAMVISNAIVHCHMRTMDRLDVTYDVLPRESEILALKFWDMAFTDLKQRGAIHMSSGGKTAGCWVMKVNDAPETGEGTEASADDDAKIIVRSNGTVTYVGKDIAYQLWKFGLLGKDFNYGKFHTTPEGHVVWTTRVEPSDPGAPSFGHASRVYNVIDIRQSYLQNIVIAGLRVLGYEAQASRSTHFSYEIVALTPRCALEMGYQLSPEDAQRNYVEVSGRRGLGVKADDLLDKLEAAARAEVDERHPELPPAERDAITNAVAIGALRYFMVRFTRNTIIAFDFKDALSFEGETGPYCQYAVVRIRGIFRKGAGSGGLDKESEIGADVSGVVLGPQHMAAAPGILAGPEGDDIWELLLLAGSLNSRVEAALKAQEPAFVAKYCFELAQTFNNFYHKHHILSEADSIRKAFLLSVCFLVERQLVAALKLLGIEAPDRM
jgi:arginyl-tRNA synthetase